MSEQRTSGTATVMFTDVESSTDVTTRLVLAHRLKPRTLVETRGIGGSVRA